MTRTRFFMASAASAVVAVGALFGLGAMMQGTESPPTQEAGIWDVPADACADPDVLDAVQTALDAPQGGESNSVLARPDEVDEASRAQQVAAWQALTPKSSPSSTAFRFRSAARSPEEARFRARMPGYS